jgi:uncharacterized membrane protein
MKQFVKLFFIGGAGYTLLEILWRGHSHPSMFVVGGTCFHLIGGIGNRLWRKSRLLALAACSSAVTMVEYVSGCFLNLRLKWNVWDYRKLPFNLHGQVCLPYSALWALLSIPVIPFYRWIQKKTTP